MAGFDGDGGAMTATSTNVMATLSGALRGVIIPAPGKQLYVADYASIEARVLLWLAGDAKALDMFRRGEDIYMDMARAINPAKPERALGKVAILGLGYGMGPEKFRATAKAWGIPIDAALAKRTVDAYRAKFRQVKALWAETEREAIEQEGWWTQEGRFLYYELPSGRRLAYPDPEVQEGATPWGEMRPCLTFMAQDVLVYDRENAKWTKKTWWRQKAYGGMLVENIVQAIARDLMAEALLRCESSQFKPILSVHDEVIAEADAGAPLAAFEALVAAVPAWADGLPVGVEAWTGWRYRK